jgi:hypothetical protein
VVQLLKSQNPDEAHSNSDMYATFKISDWYSIFVSEAFFLFRTSAIFTCNLLYSYMILIKALFFMFTLWDYSKFAIVVYKTWCLVLIVH